MSRSEQHQGDSTSQRPRCVIFCHIPKTAGHTVRRTLFEANGFAEDCYFNVRGVKSWPRLRREIRARRGNDKVIGGHGAVFGIHRVLGVTGDYITVLRNPVSMVTSFYNFVRQWDRDSGNALAREAHALSLTGFASHPKVKNRQSRMLAGLLHAKWIGETRMYHQLATPSKVAIHNLQHHFAAFATIENLSVGLHHMARRLGLPVCDGPLPTENRGWNPSPVEPTVESQGALADIMSEDMKTWEWAMEHGAGESSEAVAGSPIQ